MFNKDGFTILWGPRILARFVSFCSPGSQGWGAAGGTAFLCPYGVSFCLEWEGGGGALCQGTQKPNRECSIHGNLL